MGLEELKYFLLQHKLWLNTNGQKGIRADFSDLKLHFMDFSNQNLESAIFKRTYLHGANFENCNLTNTNFYHANLGSANLSNSDIDNTYFFDTCLRNANFRGSKLTNIEFNTCQLNFANFENTDLSTTLFINSSVYDIVLPEKSYIIEGEKYSIFIFNGKFVTINRITLPVKTWFELSRSQLLKIGGGKFIEFYPRLLDILYFYCDKNCNS